MEKLNNAQRLALVELLETARQYVPAMPYYTEYSDPEKWAPEFQEEAKRLGKEVKLPSLEASFEAAEKRVEAERKKLEEEKEKLATAKRMVTNGLDTLQKKFYEKREPRLRAITSAMAEIWACDDSQKANEIVQKFLKPE